MDGRDTGVSGPDKISPKSRQIAGDRRCPLVIDFTYILSRLLHRVASMSRLQLFGGIGGLGYRKMAEIRFN
jgi:hypothetical protein